MKKRKKSGHKQRLNPSMNKPSPTVPATEAQSSLPEKEAQGKGPTPKTISPRDTRKKKRNLLWRVFKTSWKVLVALTVLWAVVSALLYFRQEIVVEPGVSYDTSDPFSQQFSIINNGPLSIYNVHYVCSVMHLETLHPERDQPINSFVWVMLPTVQRIGELPWKQKETTDCDFIGRFGSDLKTVSAEITVFYDRRFWPWTQHTSGNKFTAKRDSLGKFVWTSGAKEMGPLDNNWDSSRRAFIQPFCGNNPMISVPEMEEKTKEVLDAVTSNGKEQVGIATLPEMGCFLH